MREMPTESNGYHADHIALLEASYRRWTGKGLGAGVVGQGTTKSESIYRAPYVLLSHGTESDPLFNYANLSGQRLFEMTWAEFMVTPSRYSAEPMVREERLKLFDRVATHGFIDDYRGVRVSKSGRRFYIDRATVWTVLDEAENLAGQAALFSEWEFLEDA